MEMISICFIFCLLLLMMSLVMFLGGVWFLFMDLTWFLEWEILSFLSESIMMVLIFDWMSLLFLSFVLFISSMVIFYSKDYMFGDMFINRFILLVLLFVFSMMMMILGLNLISILLGWDGLGLVSYCLVIYYQNVKSYNAGMLTALSNRLGDVALLMAIAWMLNFGSWNFLFYLELMKQNFDMQVICFFVVFAAMTKSAQIPFSSWLPAAMAAPTPVSALVHSSTLVTAGVYLLIRFNLLLENTTLSKFLLLISCLTMFMSGMGANFEFDLKKIIALSTLSQLGLMMSILSLGFLKLAFFHLLTHALFKALLFMSAGVIIHNLKNNQDIRNMGGLIYIMPFSIICMNISNLALCGFPFLAGFYSKDLIMEMVMISWMNLFIFFLFFISLGLTVSYTFRLVYYLFIKNSEMSSLNSVNENSKIMSLAMFMLMIWVICMGAILNWLIFPFSFMLCLTFFNKMLVILTCLMGGLGGIIFSMSSNVYCLNKSLKFINFSYFFNFMWFLPLISTVGVVFFPLKMGFSMMKLLDLGWLEFIGIQQNWNYFIKWSVGLIYIQQSMLKIMLMFFFIFFFMMILFILI
uniref:NADH dehydrogenase subunit 5 n=1 Tax=Stenochironomus tobaduodecimus TaxID=1636530 RepID=UPI001FAFDCC3|nr:NADH dehydrogenase subunit 5 [Stenochironomus tobaduodecimus]UKO33040.1 NADH dehydrogenase subunit 5 [Stenochironomus tobaduodecimus]